MSDGAVAGDPGECPFDVRPAVMLQRWETLSFLHWSYDPAVVQAMIPSSLTVEVIDGAAWVGLIPFAMTVTAPGLPVIPWVSTFLETNVRTYVRDHEGRPGIWFFSLDASRLGVVAVARAGYRLPYCWSRMRLARRGATVRYTCDRRWPGGGAKSSLAVEIGEPYAREDLTLLDHRLTARWVLFVRSGNRRRYIRAGHPPWPLYRARATHVDDGLVQAAGFPRPDSDPLVHYSPGVEVRIGMPQRYKT